MLSLIQLTCLIKNCAMFHVPFSFSFLVLFLFVCLFVFLISFSLAFSPCPKHRIEGSEFTCTRVLQIIDGKVMFVSLLLDYQLTVSGHIRAGMGSTGT